jgi:hypothetical protein
MTPAEEARFIALWQEGASYREIAQAQDCALGSVAYRAATLAKQGKIQPRPKGGAFPRQQARQGQAPARHPRATRDVCPAHPRSPRDHHGGHP